MYTAIKNMDYYKRKNNAKKLVLLGDMLELGRKSKKLHKLIEMIKSQNIDEMAEVYSLLKEAL